MKRNLFEMDETEKSRILEMHQTATSKQYLTEQKDLHRTNITLALPSSFPSLVNKPVSDLVYFITDRNLTGKNPLRKSGYTEKPDPNGNMQLGTKDGYGLTNNCPIFKTNESTYIVYGTEVTGDIASPNITNNRLCLNFTTQVSVENGLSSINGVCYFNTSSFKEMCKSIIKLNTKDDNVIRQLVSSLIKDRVVLAPYDAKSNEFADKGNKILIRNKSELDAITLDRITTIANG